MNPTAFTTRLLPWVLTAGGAVGLVAAFVLTVEKTTLLKNPDYIPTCSIDPILSCGSIMRTAQAEVFGFPNPLLGIVGFAIVVTIGVVVLAGGSLPRWFWLGLQAGTLLGVVFVHWLIYQSLYVIGALCPYCMIVWAVTIPVFWYITVHNLGEGHLPAPRRLAALATGYHGVILTVWYAAIVLLVLQAFWSYWLSLL
ncbi:vitamin K epoxide reductase family protein [Saccharothrix sp. NRRL B-16348]|uniref:vitamin K epoxide reductase family protein n=1 Tax=Saccharothrix sp. NRRL B-16348 TaxID=1415542 RepID=UPI0006AFA4C0|nr:vitamin K epoxide reductase family protein [Saccharothrix sp. NRRL B-16348]